MRLFEISDELRRNYLHRADQHVSRRMDHMARVRDSLNKGYEIYHADRPAGSTQIVDRFEADTPALAQQYYEKFIQNYESDVDFDLRLRRSTGIMESQSVSTEDIIGYIRKYHDSNLHSDYTDYITNTFTAFELKDIPVNSIKTELPKLDLSKVAKYKTMDFSKAPPIVVGDGNILDGYHRANVAKALGIPTIKAYVGIKRVNNLDEMLQAAESGVWTITESDQGVEIRKSSLFDQSLASKSQQFPNLLNKIKEFLNVKSANPGQPYPNDTPFTARGPIARALPKLRHLHLTRDLSLFYSIEGRGPTVIKLYGVFSHAESGTGTPGNINRQKNLAQQLSNQPIAEITAVPTVVKSKRQHLDVMPNEGRPIPRGEKSDYLGDLVAEMGDDFQLWSWTSHGTVTYYVFDTETRRCQLGTTGRPYKTNRDSFIIHGVYSGPQNRYRAADLYAFLILNRNLTLVSDYKQSAGGYRVWQELQRRYGKQINIHGFDTRTNEPVNVSADPKDEPDTHVDRATVKRAGPKMKKELGSISRDLRFVASAR